MPQKAAAQSTTGPWLFVLLVWLLAIARPVHAAEGVKISLNPARFEFRTYAGQQVTGTLKFWNGTDTLLNIMLQPQDFTPQDEYGHVTVGVNGNPARSLKNWITPKWPSLFVYPMQSIQLDFTVKVPDNVPPGTYWGAISVDAVPPDGREGPAIMPSVASIILLQVNGDAHEQLALERFAGPKLVDSPPVTLTALFRNDGDVYLKPEGSVEIKNLLGKVVSTAPLEGENVLPGAVRSMKALAVQGLWFGRYSAELDATYGQDKRKLSAMTWFWVIPWKSAGPTVLLWSGFAAFLIWKRKNIKPAFRGFKDAE